MKWFWRFSIDKWGRPKQIRKISIFWFWVCSQRYKRMMKFCTSYSVNSHIWLNLLEVDYHLWCKTKILQKITVWQCVCNGIIWRINIWVAKNIVIRKVKRNIAKENTKKENGKEKKNETIEVQWFMPCQKKTSNICIRWWEGLLLCYLLFMLWCL